MNCQNCDAPVSAADERCPRCGAKLLHRRVFFGAPKPADFTLTADEPMNELEDLSPEEASALLSPPQVEHAAAQPNAAPAIAPTAPRYGGFWRRLGAFFVDLVLIFALSALMTAMGYVGYKVGLAAHNRAVSLGNAGPLVLLLTLAGIFLTTGYFVVFHGMDGQTVGKRVFGLRVVGADGQRISYRRALLRWIGTVGLGVASIGLGIFWMAWSREKRAWHDYLARTWVARSEEEVRSER